MWGNDCSGWSDGLEGSWVNVGVAIAVPPGNAQEDLMELVVAGGIARGLWSRKIGLLIYLT